MRVTGIEKKSGTRYTLYIDGEYYYIFDIEILNDNHIKDGMEIDESLLEQMRIRAETRKARERAFYLISYRDHSEKELYDKLCKSVRPEIASSTIAKMLELGYLNDEAFARKTAQYYMEQKNWSFRKSMFELSRKGISGELAEQVLNECDITAADQLDELIRKKYYRNLGDKKGNLKVIAALARLGFQYGDIRQAIDNYLEEDGDQEEWQYE